MWLGRFAINTWAQVAWSQVSIGDAPALRQEASKDWIRKEVGAMIKMTLEFVKDMDMKMRDVRRVERHYYGLFDFGAGKIFQTINQKFEHMCVLYKNTSRISRIMQPMEGGDLRSKVVGMLQFMLSDYMEILSLIDVFKERYTYWKATSRVWQIRDQVQKFLVSRNVFPYNYVDREDEWR